MNTENTLKNTDFYPVSLTGGAIVYISNRDIYRLETALDKALQHIINPVELYALY